MRGKLMFLAGLGAGFVLGSRAGREKYEELVQTARKVRENPTVQEAAGVVQEQANKFVSTGRGAVTDRLSNSRFAETKVGEKVLSAVNTDRPSRTTGAPDPLTTTEPLPTTEPLASTDPLATRGTATSTTGTASSTSDY
jgi:hypothetical protein